MKRDCINCNKSRRFFNKGEEKCCFCSDDEVYFESIMEASDEERVYEVINDEACVMVYVSETNGCGSWEEEEGTMSMADYEKQVRQDWTNACSLN